MAVLEHTMGMIFRPEAEWEAIREDKLSGKEIFLSNVPFLALIPVICAYIGSTIVGWQVGDGPVMHLTAASALTLCVSAYFAYIASIYILGLFISWMVNTYGVPGTDEEKQMRGMAMSTYMSVPVSLSGFALLYPSIWFCAAVLGAAICYSVYLIYTGMPKLMEIEKERAFMYSTSVLTVSLVLGVSVLAGSVLIWGLGIGPVYTDSL